MEWPTSVFFDSGARCFIKAAGFVTSGLLKLFGPPAYFLDPTQGLDALRKETKLTFNREDFESWIRFRKSSSCHTGGCSITYNFFRFEARQEHSDRACLPAKIICTSPMLSS